MPVKMLLAANTKCNIIKLYVITVFLVYPYVMKYLSLYADPMLRVYIFLVSCTLLPMAGWTDSGMQLTANAKRVAKTVS